METLIDILNLFNENRKASRNKTEWEIKSLDEKYKAVAGWFRPCAEKLLCKGYFLINDKYIIDLGAIELYYHEEDGEIKDHIMYHTNEHLPKSYKKIIEKYKDSIWQLPYPYRKIQEEMKKNGGYPFFDIGSFNLHQSGIDVTFENSTEGDRYRASFLIRSYRMFEKGEKEKDFLYDSCSSHLYDDLYYSGLLSMGKNTIKWEELSGDKGVTLDKDKHYTRKNVALYRLDGTKYVKLTKDYYLSSKDSLEEQIPELKFSKIESFKTSGKEYIQDPRPWLFQIEGLKEKEIK